MGNEPLDIKQRRGIYLLPNLFTTGALFAGFYAVIASMKGEFSTAGLAIFVAMVADSLDGRLARLTNTQTDFGVEYDSLSDMVSFGVAPSLVVYHWALSGLGKPGWLASFLYTACTALRLARFNTQVGEDRQYFKGLPSPAAAGLLGGWVWMSYENQWIGHGFSIFTALLTTIAASLMVSNIRYYSFKEIDFKGKVPFFAVLLVLMGYVSITVDPPQLLCLIFFAYGLSGPSLTFWQWRRAREKRSNRLH